MNESERSATEYLITRLNGGAPDQKWVLLTNLSHTRGAQYLADELDIVAIGPSGIHPIEVKHWDLSNLRQTHARSVDHEAYKLNTKVKRIKGHLAHECGLTSLFVEGKFLFTRPSQQRSSRDADDRPRIAGVAIYHLRDWRELLAVDHNTVLTDSQIDMVCEALARGAQLALNGDIRSLGPFYDLERVSPAEEAFHRVYRGRRRPGHDRVIVHLYDLSATNDRNAGTLAERECQVLQRLQKSRWLPSLMDSFQEFPAYPGEIFFFSLADTQAPTLRERATDQRWEFDGRLRFAIRCLDALHTLHAPDPSDQMPPTLHRNLSPDTIHVRSSDAPLFTGLQWASVSDLSTLVGKGVSRTGGDVTYVAPRGPGERPCCFHSVLGCLRSLRLTHRTLRAESGPSSPGG